ncbi:MAG: hypothetical protein CMK49_03055 [Prochlorococcus sp. SP3034]|nr:hypothetical protein [Prochlorococcus sp. SP3034]
MKLNFYLIFLYIFIFVDLSNEIKIITDHFTFSALYFSFMRNPLSFFIIFTLPYLQKKLK